MKHLLAIFLACLPLLASDGIFLVVRTGAPLNEAIAYINAKTEWQLDGTGSANIALPAFLHTDGTNQVTVRARYTHLWASQVPPLARTKLDQLAAKYPGQLAVFQTTNGVVNVSALLASLPTPLAPKVSTQLTQ